MGKQIFVMKTKMCGDMGQLKIFGDRNVKAMQKEQHISLPQTDSA